MNQELVSFLKKNINVSLDFEKLLEKPKHESHGDFSLPCFLIAKEISERDTRMKQGGVSGMKQNPAQVAQELQVRLNDILPTFLSKVQAVGPFINFYLDNVQEVQEIFENFNSLLIYKVKKPEKILIEYPSPNTNKSLHIGHTRNMLLGTALSNTLKKVGHNTIRTNLNNDRGISICYAMLMYQEFYSSETPKSMNMKPDEFVAHCYVEFKKKCAEFPERNFEEQAQKMLVEWEAGNKEVRALWKKLLDYVYVGYHKTYENYHLREFDKQYFESEIFDQGKEIVLDALNKNIKGFKKNDDGAIYVDLEEEGFGEKYLLRGDQTTLYMTQDIYLANIKEQDFHADKYIFVVGQEQEYHFKVLFELLDRLNISDKSKNYHFAYGYVYNEKGEKFSSRLGNTIGADFIYEEIIAKAKENLLQKELTKNLPLEELNQRAEAVGFGALVFTFLKQNALASMNFSMENALSFEGETGPYCQYTYARIQSLKRRVTVSYTHLTLPTTPYV